MGEQFRTRLNSHLNDGLIELCARNSFSEVADVVKSLLRHALVAAPDLLFSGLVAQESPAVQAIVDEMILQQFQSGVRLKGKDEERWIREKIEEARARLAEQRQKSPKYYIVLGARIIGPHRLDKLREWVALDIIPQETIVQREQSQTSCPVKMIPKFHDYSALLRRKIDEQKKAAKPDWWSEKPTEAQRKKLDFFEIPYKREGLTKGRASELLSHFMFIDPPREQQYRQQQMG